MFIVLKNQRKPNIQQEVNLITYNNLSHSSTVEYCIAVKNALEEYLKLWENYILLNEKHPAIKLKIQCNSNFVFKN